MVWSASGINPEYPSYQIVTVSDSLIIRKWLRHPSLKALAIQHWSMTTAFSLPGWLGPVVGSGSPCGSGSKCGRPGCTYGGIREVSGTFGGCVPVLQHCFMGNVSENSCDRLTECLNACISVPLCIHLQRDLSVPSVLVTASCVSVRVFDAVPCLSPVVCVWISGRHRTAAPPRPFTPISRLHVR